MKQSLSFLSKSKKVFQNYSKQSVRALQRRRLMPFAFVFLVFSIGGVIALTMVQAATVTVPFEIESGVVASPARIVNDDLASNKQTVEFAAASKRLHFILNTYATDAPKLRSLGYDLLDSSPAELAAVNSLPANMRAVLWTGGAFCDADGIMAWDDFRALVDAQRNNLKVYGYFIFDEPDTHACAGIADRLRDRADYIHCLGWRNSYHDAAKQHPKVDNQGNCLNASGTIIPRLTDKKAIVIDEYQHDYAKVSAAITHVDVFGIDPYPCRPNGCDFSLVRDLANKAKNYYPESKIAPVLQVFGGDGWRLPTGAELRTLLTEWDRALPNAPMDITYSYRDNKSGGPADTYPGLYNASNLESILKEHNLK